MVSKGKTAVFETWDAFGCADEACEDRIGEGRRNYLAKKQRTNGAVQGVLTRKARLERRNMNRLPVRTGTFTTERQVNERPFTSRIQALRARDSTVEQIDKPQRIASERRVDILKQQLDIVRQQKMETERASQKLLSEAREAIIASEKENQARMTRVMENNNCVCGIGKMLKYVSHDGARKGLDQKPHDGVYGGIEKPPRRRNRISIKATLRARGCLIARRFSIQSGLSYSALKRAVFDVFGARENFLLRYEDDCGDFITVSSDNEVAELYHVIARGNLDPLVVELL